MRLFKARIRGYRSIKDTGYFELEDMKTIMVGPNEAGKTAILQALQKLNPPKGVALFNPLRDYPRSKYDEDVIKKGISPDTFTVVEGHFKLSREEADQMPPGFDGITFVFGRYLNNNTWYRVDGGIQILEYGEIEKDLARLVAHMDASFQAGPGVKPGVSIPSQDLQKITAQFTSQLEISATIAKQIIALMDKNLLNVDESNEREAKRFDKIKAALQRPLTREEVSQKCLALLPTFVLFNNYFRVRPSIHLQKLAERTTSGVLDDTQYDYGNNCLLKFLGFSAEELSKAGETSGIDVNRDMQKYMDKLDERNYRLNAASVKLTKEIVGVWNPDQTRQEASKLNLRVDGQYLKVVVEDELGVEVELDQRSEGFQWLVSFFVVFFAEAEGKHKNAILLLDEPGLSLHALKQAEFRATISKLSEKNQTIFTTHSPFLVGANELDFVRVVEMPNREIGTIVHTTITATDAKALLPLQEALGYDLAQSLFVHQKNLILEGLTDYWYLEAIGHMLSEAKIVSLDQNIALIPASSASKVSYYATILHAQNLKIAALLDSDAAGDSVAQQDVLVHTLKRKQILRTKDAYRGPVTKPEIEDLFRETLVSIAKGELGWNVEAESASQPSIPIIDVFTKSVGKDFSKYKLAKAFLRWCRDHSVSDMTASELRSSQKLVELVNSAFK